MRVMTRQLIENLTEFDKPLFLCFVDFKEAFNRIRLNEVLNALKQSNYDNKYLKIDKELNGNKQGPS